MKVAHAMQTKSMNENEEVVRRRVDPWDPPSQRHVNVNAPALREASNGRIDDSRTFTRDATRREVLARNGAHQSANGFGYFRNGRAVVSLRPTRQSDRPVCEQ